MDALTSTHVCAKNLVSSQQLSSSIFGFRWTFRLEETTDGRLQKSMWRKNHQWLGLVRKHARLTVADEEIAAV